MLVFIHYENLPAYSCPNCFRLNAYPRYVVRLPSVSINLDSLFVLCNLNKGMQCYFLQKQTCLFL